MSAQDLSDACGELGLTFSRSAIANLESGRRPTVSVAELLVLGKALGVPPMLLVLPLGQENAEEVEVLPGVTMDTWEAVQWFDGEDAFLQQDEDGYWFTFQPEYDEWEITAAPLSDYRIHEEHAIEWKNLLRRADARRRIARDPAAKSEEREHNLQGAKEDDARVRAIEKELARLRADMRRRGLTPPKLDPLLAHIDDKGR